MHRVRLCGRAQPRSLLRAPLDFWLVAAVAFGSLSKGCVAIADYVLSAAGNFTCALATATGGVKCWGRNEHGQLGYGDVDDRGSDPNEMAGYLPYVQLGSGMEVAEVSVGYWHGCVRLVDGMVKCWGLNADGQLGPGNAASRGASPADMGDNLPTVNLGDKVWKISCGGMFTCAILGSGDATSGEITCWGSNAHGEAPQVVALPSGRKAKDLALGREHACALLDDQKVFCWGNNAHGELGQGTSQSIGDALQVVDLGHVGGVPYTATQVTAGEQHTCAILQDGSVRCWGHQSAFYGSIGDEPGEMGDYLQPPAFWSRYMRASSIDAGSYHNCALLLSATVHCWAQDSSRSWVAGSPEEAMDLPADLIVTQIAVGAQHACAAIQDGEAIKCWGKENTGYGDSDPRGRDRPRTMGDNLLPVHLANSPTSTKTPSTMTETLTRSSTTATSTNAPSTMPASLTGPPPASAPAPAPHPQPQQPLGPFTGSTLAKSFTTSTTTSSTTSTTLLDSAVTDASGLTTASGFATTFTTTINSAAAVVTGLKEKSRDYLTMLPPGQNSTNFTTEDGSFIKVTRPFGGLSTSSANQNDNITLFVGPEASLMFPASTLVKFSSDDVVVMQVPSDTSDIFRELMTSSVSSLQTKSASFSLLGLFDIQVFPDTANESRHLRFTDPVRLRMPVNSSIIGDDEAVCMYWDEQAGNWSTEGVKTTYEEDGPVVCLVSHFSLFAVFRKVLMCSNAHLFTSEGLKNLMGREDKEQWWRRPAALLLWLVMLVHCILLVVAAVGDRLRRRSGHRPGVLACQMKDLDKNSLRDTIAEHLARLRALADAAYSVLILRRGKVAAVFLARRGAKLMGAVGQGVPSREFRAIRKSAKGHIKAVIRTRKSRERSASLVSNDSGKAVSSSQTRCESSATGAAIQTGAEKRRAEDGVLQLHHVSPELTRAPSRASRASRASRRTRRKSKVQDLHETHTALTKAVEERARVLLSKRTPFKHKFFLFLRVLHPWTSVCMSSYFANASLLQLLQFARDMGGLATAALFLEVTDTASDWDSNPACRPSDAVNRLLMTVVAGVISTAIGNLPVLALAIMATTGHIVDHGEPNVVRWYLRHALLGLLGCIYVGTAALFVATFIANVNAESSKDWTIAACISLIKTNLATPIVTAALFAAACQLCSGEPEVLKEVIKQRSNGEDSDIFRTASCAASRKASEVLPKMFEQVLGKQYTEDVLGKQHAPEEKDTACASREPSEADSSQLEMQTPSEEEEDSYDEDEEEEDEEEEEEEYEEESEEGEADWFSAWSKIWRGASFREHHQEGVEVQPRIQRRETTMPVVPPPPPELLIGASAAARHASCASDAATAQAAAAPELLIGASAAATAQVDPRPPGKGAFLALRQRQLKEREEQEAQEELEQLEELEEVPPIPGESDMLPATQQCNDSGQCHGIRPGVCDGALRP